MKYILLAVLGCTFLSTSQAANPFWYTTNDASFYCYSNSGAISINDYGGSSVAVIPSTIYDLPVTRIGIQAFEEYSYYLRSVTIPDSVTNIGSEAFGSSGLTNVTMGGGIISIEQNAFDSCYWLPSITIPDSVISIGDYAFETAPA